MLSWKCPTLKKATGLCADAEPACVCTEGFRPRLSAELLLFFCMKYFPKLNGFPVITNWSILPRNTNVWQHGNSCPASWPGPEVSVCHSQLVRLTVPWALCPHQPHLRGPCTSFKDVTLAYLLCWNTATMTPTSGRFQVTPGPQRMCL